MQPDLFGERAAPCWWLGEGEKAQAERMGWTLRLMRDAIDRSGCIECCFPGFSGAACERAVERLWMTREAVGPMPRPEWWDDKKHGSWAKREPAPMFRYSITDAGRRMF